jgi:hypothetical protein
MSAEKIGWQARKLEPRAIGDGDWLIAYGMGTGSFGAMRWVATVKGRLEADIKLLLQCLLLSFTFLCIACLLAFLNSIIKIPLLGIDTQG